MVASVPGVRNPQSPLSRLYLKFSLAILQDLAGRRQETQEVGL